MLLEVLGRERGFMEEGYSVSVGWIAKRVPFYRLSGLWGVISSFGDVSNVGRNL